MVFTNRAKQNIEQMMSNSNVPMVSTNSSLKSITHSFRNFPFQLAKDLLDFGILWFRKSAGFDCDFQTVSTWLSIRIHRASNSVHFGDVDGRSG